MVSELFVAITFAISFIVTLLATPIFIKAAKRKGMMGFDAHKKGRPRVAELGGISIAAGVTAALLFAIAATSFVTLQQVFPSDIAVTTLLAVLSVILIIELLGLVDDILGISQLFKFLLPFGAALPLMAVKIVAAQPLTIPFMGVIPFISPLIYGVFLVPIGVVASTNLTNTFAGFNGLEAGTGAIALLTLAIIGMITGNIGVTILSVSLLGALVAFLKYNWYPSQIFPDDVGTLLIGAMIGAIVIVGGIEVAGVILLLPHILDFVFFKVPNKLPREVESQYTEKAGTLVNGKLIWKKKLVSLLQVPMRMKGGISEKSLVLLFLGIEVILGAVAILIYMA